MTHLKSISPHLAQLESIFSSKQFNVWTTIMTHFESIFSTLQHLKKSWLHPPLLVALKTPKPEYIPISTPGQVDSHGPWIVRFKYCSIVRIFCWPIDQCFKKPKKTIDWDIFECQPFLTVGVSSWVSSLPNPYNAINVSRSPWIFSIGTSFSGNNF